MAPRPLPFRNTGDGDAAGNPWADITAAIPVAQAAVSQAAPGVSGGVTSRPDQMPGGGSLGQASRAEQQQAHFQGQFQAPGTGEQQAYDYARQQAGQMGAGNTQQQYSQQFQQQIGQDPGLGAYYDRATERATTDINAQLASRGAYGSSRGLGMLGDAIGGLGAERANREADYMMQQQQLGGQLAQQAGQSQLDWTQGLGAMGLAADRLGTGRAVSGINAATAADAGFLGRKGMAFDQLAGMTGMTTGIYNPAYQGMIQGDLDMLGAGLTGNLAATGLQTDVALGEDVEEAAHLGKVGQVMGSVMGAV